MNLKTFCANSRHRHQGRCSNDGGFAAIILPGGYQGRSVYCVKQQKNDSKCFIESVPNYICDNAKQPAIKATTP